MHIKKVKRKHIELKAWDRCIESADNRRIYAMSWYLDAVSGQCWDALVYKNYQAVMPLPYIKKAGIKVYIQPVFCQQLGVFWHGQAPKDMVKSFIQAIPGNLYKLCFTGQTSYYMEAEQSFYRPNYTIKLSCDYDKMLKIMSNNHRRNIRKAQKAQLQYHNISPETYIQLKRSSGTRLSNKVWNNLLNLLNTAVEKQAMNIRAAFLDNELISAVCWLNDFDRFVYLQAASNSKGKATAAAFGLIDEHLRIHENSGKIIDFEGSQNNGVARFYKGFGGKNEAYPCIESKWMKKLNKKK